MERRYWLAVILLIARPTVITEAQNYGQQIPPSGQYTFYLNKLSDCDGKPRNVGDATVNIFGVTSEPQGRGATSCTITLDSENRIEPKKFKIQFLRIYIGDENVHFYIYDGNFDGGKLHIFSKHQTLPQGVDYTYSTSQRVTFRLTRGERDVDYDIRLTATPVPRDETHCQYGTEYGCGEYGYEYRVLGMKEIAGIIGGAFGLIIVIVVIIVCCCYRKQRGISRRWKEEKLGAENTAASLHSLNGKVSKSNQGPRPWTSESSKNEFASIRRSPKLPRVSVTRHVYNANRDHDKDKDSAFGSSESLHRKQQAPVPTHVRDLPRETRRDNRDRDYRDRDYRKKDYRDRDYDVESDRSYKSDRHYKPPTYREALRHDQSRSESEIGDATEHSFVQADDDHPQKVFIERVIEPRVKPKKQASPMQQKRVIPPPEEDLTYDSIEPKKTTLRTAKTAKSKAVEAEEEDDNETDESDTSNSDNESEESEEESEESEEEPQPKKMDKPDAVDVYSKVNKNKGKQDEEKQQFPNPGFMPPQQGFMPPPQNMQGPPYPGYFPPGVHQPQPRYGYPMQQGYPYQGQLPPQGQGMQPPNTYDQANFTVPMNQQGPPPMMQYNNSSAQPRQPHQSRKHNQPGASQQPNNPPVYSYLVNRGYQPLDGRHSPISTATGGSNISGDRNIQVVEDSDFSANLGSGVELLKRK